MDRAQIESQREVVVVIDEYSDSGEGCVQLDDGVLTVSGAIPGERVVARLRDHQPETSRQLMADVVDVLESADERRDPLCQRDDICRGCQLRHLTVAAELEWKVEQVRRAVEEKGGVAEAGQPEIEVVTPQPIARGDAFRIRCELHYRRVSKGFELGLQTPLRERLVPMVDCPAQTGPMQRLIGTVEETLSSCRPLPPDPARGEPQDDDPDRPPALKSIRVISPTHGVGLVELIIDELDDGGDPSEAILDDVYGPWCEALIDAVPENVGVAIRGGEVREVLAEPRRIRIPIGKWNMEIGYDDWVHTTLEPAQSVYETLMRWLDCSGDDRLLDIGCGTGTITLMTSEEVEEVVGVDVNPSSIEAAELNAIGHGRSNVQFVAAGWERALRQLAMDDQRFSVATINPNEAPLGRRTLAFLDVLDVDRLVYLGPSPTSAACDLGELREMGWGLTKLGAANLHPATERTLLMAAMERP